MTASSALAAFADLHLIRVYYDRTGGEIATDLGRVKDVTAAGQSGIFNGTFGSLTTGYAAYFAFDLSTNELWASGKPGVPSVITGNVTQLRSGFTYLMARYNTQGGGVYSGPTSYYQDKLSTPKGSLGNSISPISQRNTEASLAEMISTGSGSVTQSLYFWNNAATTVAAEKIGVAVATITTNANGSTIIDTANTPIPPAIFLMGSGLLGMFGLRRKAKA